MIIKKTKNKYLQKTGIFMRNKFLITSILFFFLLIKNEYIILISKFYKHNIFHDILELMCYMQLSNFFILSEIINVFILQ